MSSSSERRGLAILGATGSIGRNAVAVARAFPERFRVEVATCAHQGGLLRELAASCGARDTWCAADAGSSTLRDEDELCELLAGPRVDIVLCAIQGIAALRAVLCALRAGKRVALATKEVLVAAGAWVKETARRGGGEILPVDSEHCALFQCLRGEAREGLKRLILTCSGGPFHAHPEIDLHAVTPEQAMRHPTWAMGAKITLDSATLMNKGFEILEARWLYDVSEAQVAVVIHPQSVIHSLVEFRDGAVLAQLGPTDMKMPIQYCLTYPERCPAMMRPLDFGAAMRLDFAPPDTRRFPALEVAREAGRRGGLAGAVFNAANDAACRRFRAGTLAFDEIAPAVGEALEQTPAGAADSFEALAAANAAAEEAVRAFRADRL